MTNSKNKIGAGLRQIEIEEKKVRNFNEDLLEELEASKDNIDKMISKREEIKTKVTRARELYENNLTHKYSPTNVHSFKLSL